MQSLVSGPCGVLQSGDAATWLGSVGTLLAFGVALALFSITVRDRSRMQARLVSGYISQGRVKHLPGATFRTDDGQQYAVTSGLLRNPSPGAPPNSPLSLTAEAISYAWVVQNDSDEMIGRVRLILTDADGEEVSELMARNYMRPKQVEKVVVVVPPEDAPTAPLRPKLMFEDAVGRCWERTPGQPLRSISRRAARTRLWVPEPSAGTWVPVDPATPHIRRFEA